jgi:hypothetical protein
MTARLVRAFVIVILCLSFTLLVAGEETKKIQQKGKNMCERSSQLTKEEGANMLKQATTHRTSLLHQLRDPEIC